MLKHVLIFLAALLMIASCEVDADKKIPRCYGSQCLTGDASSSELVKKDVEEKAVVAQMIADEMENADDEEYEIMKDEKFEKKMKDAWWGRRREKH